MKNLNKNYHLLKEALLSVWFSPAHEGWIELHINCTSKNLIIPTTELFDPYPNLVHWLEHITINELPCIWEIEGEGPTKQFQALPTTAGDVNLTIQECVKNDAPHIITTLNISQKTLVKKFYTAFQESIQTGFEPHAWHTDLRTLDFSTVEAFIKNGPSSQNITKPQ